MRAGSHRGQVGDRQASRASRADRHDRGAAPFPLAPDASFGRPSGEARLVLEADVTPEGRLASFTSALVASFRAVTPCSSRSVTRRMGTCGDKPSRCITPAAPERCRRRGTSCRSAAPTSLRSTPCSPPSRARPAPAPDMRRVSPGNAGRNGTVNRSGHGRQGPAHRRRATSGAPGRPRSGQQPPATSGDLVSCSNNSAACIHTVSRRPPQRSAPPHRVPHTPRTPTNTQPHQGLRARSPRRAEVSSAIDAMRRGLIRPLLQRPGS